MYGGQNIQRQLETLRKKPQIVIATPGRLFDHMERHTIKLNAVKYVVLDEGDEMFDMGFRGDIEQIFKKCPKDCQKLVFSATIPREIQKLINESLTNPQYFKVENDKENMPKIAQRYTILKDSQRVPAIIQIIAENNYKLCLIFCNTKMRADRISEALVSKGKNAM
ncbi:MAG: DEAD/DEAH box helicase, partial [Clostridia bacterium]